MVFNTETVEFTVPRSTYYLSFIRKITLDLARRSGFGENTLGQIEMAIDEACANAMIYPEGKVNKALELQVSLSQHEFAVTLCDGGAAYNFNELGMIDIDEHNSEASPGGMGIYIIKNFMDDVSYEYREGAGNVLRMVKYREGVALSSTY